MTGNKTALTVLMAVALLTTAALAGPAVAPVQGQSDDDGLLDTLFGGEDGDLGILDAATAYAGGLMDRYSPWSGAEKADSEDYAEDVQATINANSDTLRNWTNERATADTDHDVARVKLTDEDGGSTWLFIVSDVNASTGEYTSLKAMGLSEFKDTGREVDLTYRLDSYASRNADDELETFVSEYAEPGDDVTKEYLLGLAGKYGGGVSGDELPGADS